MYVNHNIKLLRKRENLSQEEFANLFGINRSNVGSYEEGRAVPPLELIIKISKYFNIKMEELIEKDISTQPNYAEVKPEPDQNDDDLNSSKIKYTKEEIALLAIRSDVFTRALMQTSFDAIASWAELIKPELKDLLIAELPKMLADRYKQLLINDNKISEDLADKLVQEMKASLYIS